MPHLCALSHHNILVVIDYASHKQRTYLNLCHLAKINCIQNSPHTPVLPIYRSIFQCNRLYTVKQSLHKMIPALKSIIYIAVMMIIVGTKTQYHAVSSNKFLCNFFVGDKVRHLVP